MRNEDEGSGWVWFIVALVFSLLLLRETYINDSLRKEAIELNYAEHNRTSGEWQWKDNQ